MTLDQMGARISRIQETASVKEVARLLGMPVVKRGASFLTICPFHSDTTPSLTLYDEQPGNRHYHCYACGAHGDVFALVQQVRGIDFINAAEWLAQQLGLPTPTAGKNLEKERGTVNARLHGLELILEVFKANSDEQLLSEFVTLRNISDQVAQLAEITAIRGGVLVRHIQSLKEAGQSWREVQGYFEETGLLRSYATSWSPSTNLRLDVTSGLRDFFYDDRIIFPIRNARGGLIGFAGRRVDWDLKSRVDEAPKYLYSPKLAKGNILYRPNVVSSGDLTSQSQQLFVVEGLVDVIRSESLKLPAVAILGAIASSEQETLLQRHVEALGGDSKISVFLDRDSAGIRGAAKLVAALYQRGVICDFIWPTRNELSALSIDPDSKDPDEILRDMDGLTALVLVSNWTRPGLLVLLAHHLNTSPEEILVPETWNNISRSRKARALSEISTLVRDPIELLTSLVANRDHESGWIEFSRNFYSTPSSQFSDSDTSFVTDETARLNLARSLACSGVQRGDMAPDLVAWRRLDVLATAFNEAFKSRIQQQDLRPIEPFDAMYVSRGTGKREFRLKVMPCPEDLVVQQYFLNEILTERNDQAGVSATFSNAVPAVRYYRDGFQTLTTGTDTGRPEHETLSFAYQLDMDVLEGRQPPSGNGIFRPYFQCWKDFIAHLRRTGEQMSKVHVLRLDVRRYYDELGRGIVRDLLRKSLGKAVRKVGGNKDWIPLFGTSDLQHRSEMVVDWLCDQSFGFSYFDPETGIRKMSSADRGIPQGPVLSAWLGTAALFPLDDLMRKVMKDINGTDQIRVGYGRYVDDIVLIAESEELLAVMKARAEDAVKRLSLTLIQKADPVPPMSVQDFAQFLTEGRAFATSEPDAEPMVFDAGDGEAGWQMWGWEAEEVERSTALHLLHDKRLYDVTYEQALDHLFTALRADDLRPKDLAKASRWLWLHSALKCAASDGYVDLWQLYRSGWKTITKGSVWITSDIGCPWEDPAFYALEGLEKLLDVPQSHDPIREGRPDLIKALRCVATATLESRFIEEFLAEAQAAESTPWGYGPRKLSRMFWNHALPLQTKAVKLLGESSDHKYAEPLSSAQQQQVAALGDSLIRARLTHYEATGAKPIMPARAGGTDNPLHDGIIWFHTAYVRFINSNKLTVDEEPLEGSVAPAWSLRGADPIHRVPNDRFMPLIDALYPYRDEKPEQEVAWLAMATLSILSDWKSFGPLMERREALARISLGASPLPILPGIVPKDLLLIRMDPNAQISEFVPANSIKVLAGDTTPGNQTLPFCEVSDSQISVRFVTPSWRSDTAANEVLGDQLRLFDADLSIPPLGVYLQAPVATMRTNALAFAADVFEGLAALNHSTEVEGDERTEYVPAWPYFALPGKVTDDLSLDPTVFALLCLPISTAELGGQAFIRSGSRGLQTVSVPSDNAHLWRAGVAISDLMGLNEDVDKYRVTLESNTGLSALRYEVLLQSMRRLRGCFYRHSGLVRIDRAKPHLPASISRVLRGMREFPVDDDSAECLSFAISLKHETNAMAVRLSVDGEAFDRSASARFLEQTARITTRSIPAAYLAGAGEGDYQGAPLRHAVRGYRLLLSRLRSLPPPTLEHVDLAWRALIAGLEIASLTAWLRSLAFELLADDRKKSTWSVDLVADVTNVWGIGDPKLVLSSYESEQASLSSLFRGVASLVPQKARQFIDAITPLGWLALVADQIGIFSLGQSRTFSFKGKDGSATQLLMEKFVAQLAAQFSSDTEHERSADDYAESWPFDLSEDMITRWGNLDFDSSSRGLQLIDQYCDYSVRHVANRRWVYNPGPKTFDDGNGQTVPLLSWQISSLGEGNVWSEVLDQRYVSSWSETRDSDDRLLGVSIWRRSFGELVSAGVGFRNRNSEISQSDRESPRGGVNAPGSLNERVGDPVEQPALKAAASPSEPPQAESQASGWKPAAESMQAPTGDRTVRRNRPSSLKERLRDIQSRSWRARSKTGDRVRVAILQWQVDDTYRHPIFDLGIDEAIEKAVVGEEAFSAREKIRANYEKVVRSAKDASSVDWGSADADDDMALLFAQCCSKNATKSVPWTESRRLQSWAEHRRRRIIEEALDACSKLSVDVLVLPEYSVRPDTIVWLASLLGSKGYQVAVQAGTYRLFGTSLSPGFEETLGQAFGVSDYLDIFGPAAGDGDSASNRELSALLSYLAPVGQVVKGLPPSAVSVFTRRKKYPSAAADEIFNPGGSCWSPLYSVRAAIQDLQRRGPDGRRSKNVVRNISADEALDIASRHMSSQHIAELICSEIFLATSPANISALVDQYQQLRARFGTELKARNVLGELQNDILAMGAAFGRRTVVDADAFNLVRRTILVVPAMTTRSADYWIFGQSGLLAAGLTTVFCNASCKPDAVGGSCIVGYNSWKESKVAPGLHAHVTPYSGWSRGIYYNKASDALGEEEQALVVVDIDPTYMNEGKPRPQTMLKPLQLVAHIPIVETVWQEAKAPKESQSSSSASNECGTAKRVGKKRPIFREAEFEVTLEQVLSFDTRFTHLWDPLAVDGSGISLLSASETLGLFTADSQAMKDRLAHWSHFWRDLPWANAAPAVIDFLWVDHSEKSEVLPLLFIPSWASD